MPYKNPEDQRAAAKRHYEANKEEYKLRALKHHKRAIGRNRLYVYRYLLDHSCVDCGEDNPVVLEFDHDKSLEKTANISNLISSGVSIDKLNLEISKCSVRCANCHRIKTANEENWWIAKAVKNLAL